MTQQEALDVLKMGHNVYLTGSAGSGKTYLLNQYISYLQKHGIEVGITASTGIAATHMNGTTIHSWCGLGIKSTLSPMELEALEEKKYLWRRLENTKVLIIDEVSMLHHFRLDLIDKICRTFKRRDIPFGGMQVILCGDFFQLPPVARSHEPKPQFIYKSEAWQTMNLKICYLHEQFRQKDQAFLSILKAIRTNFVSEPVRSLLHKRFNIKPTGSILPTKLYTHNEDVDAVNNTELEKLSGEIHEYLMKSDGREHMTDVLKKSCLAQENLRFKLGAQVMFVKNNYEVGYVNGTRGTIVGFTDKDIPIVQTLGGPKIEANPVEWQIAEEGKVLAKITQIPLRLAWAITIHKSQGMSLDTVEIDLSKSFEVGMGYVALSRVRSLDGLSILGLNDTALAINKDVLVFDQALQKASEKVVEEIARIAEADKQLLQNTCLELMKPKPKKKKVLTHHVTKTFIVERKALKVIADKRGITIGTVIDHIEKNLLEDTTLDIHYLKETTFTPNQFQQIADAFSKSLKENGDFRLAPVKDMLGTKVSYEDLRLARLFIEMVD